MKVEQIEIASLIPHEKNVRIHGSDQMKELQKSFRMFGQFRPIVTDEKNVILVGHGIWAAMKNEGAKQCAVHRVTGLSESKKLKLMLADNKTYELGSMDFDAFDDVLRMIAGEEDLDIPGYDADTLEVLVQSQVDDARDVDERIQSYGKISDERVEQIKSAGESYNPEVRQGPSEIEINPAKVQVEMATSTERARPYTVCPNCGEKVWL